MLPTLVIVFREVFEAGLIVGIVMAVTSGVAARGRWVAGGVAAGVFGACVVALFTGGLSELFGGSGQELFNASILGFAVLMLAWHNVWMARHGRELAAELRAAGEAVAAGSKSLAALAVVVAIAVLREGSEVVLFLYGVAAAQGGAGRRHAGRRRDRACSRRAGLPPGLSRPHHHSDALSLRRHHAMITLLAAGMAAQAIAFLEQAGLLTARDQTVWDTSWILSDASYLGRALHTLIGYVDQPTAMQLVVYAATLAVIALLMKLFAAPPAQRPQNGLTFQAIAGPGGEVIRAQRRREDLAEIGELRLQAFHLETNDAAAGEGQRHRAGRTVAFGEFDGEQVEQGVLVRPIETAAFAGIDPLEAQRGPAAPVVRLGRRLWPSAAFIQSKRLSAITKRCSRGCQRMSATLTQSILHMGGDDLDVIIVEGNELEFLHDRVLFSAIFSREN